MKTKASLPLCVTHCDSDDSLSLKLFGFRLRHQTAGTCPSRPPAITANTVVRQQLSVARRWGWRTATGAERLRPTGARRGGRNVLVLQAKEGCYHKRQEQGWWRTSSCWEPEGQVTVWLTASVAENHSGFILAVLPTAMRNEERNTGWWMLWQTNKCFILALENSDSEQQQTLAEAVCW